MKARLEKKVLVRDDHSPGLPGLIQAGPFLFVGGCDGHRPLGGGAIDPALAGQAEAQCENVYGKIGQLLGRAGVGYPEVVRLDHATSSQDWLARRQTVRGRLFSQPAPLASAGVAARMSGINMITGTAIAVADARDKRVLVSGPKYGMHNISSAVQAGDLVFISGVRGIRNRITGASIAEETPDAFPAQVRTCYELIKTILDDCDLGVDALLRLDCYVRDIRRGEEELQVRRQTLGAVECSRTIVGLPLGARGEVEIAAIALNSGQKRVGAGLIEGGGLLFIDECQGDLNRGDAGNLGAQLDATFSILEEKLKAGHSSLDRVVRLELYLRDINQQESALDIVRKRFGAFAPVVFIVGAELGGIAEVKLNAIAV